MDARTRSGAAGVAGAGAVILASVLVGEARAQDMRLPAVAGVAGATPGRVLIQLRPEAAARAAGGGLTGDATIDAALARQGARTAALTVRAGFAKPAVASGLGLDRWRTVTLHGGADPWAVAAALRACPGIERAEPDGLGGVAGDPDDTWFANQWGLRNTGQNFPGAGVAGADIHAEEGWALATPVNDVLIAVIDTGIDPNHPDLAGRVVPGWNIVSNNGQTVDSDCPHGTMIAGVVGALTNNTMGIAGVFPRAKLMPVRVLAGCSGSESDCAAGIVWAADHGATVANMSLQYYTGTTVLAQAVQYAHQAGMVMVCAAGNYAGAQVAFPARFPETIAVSSTNNQDQLSSFSNYGPQIDLAAPGEQVYATSYGGGYTYASGTSLASPHVAGAACLVRSLAPVLTASEVDALLRASGDDLGVVGFDNQYGNGRLNLAKAVTLALRQGCYANCDHSVDPPVLNSEDFNCFLLKFLQGDPAANCDGSPDGMLDSSDFNCFLLKYIAGCPA